mmetsp:Transcript_15543/g.25220  ORF Transcript_15543/g.25220 Transcript_15543/m.25220 type:complete len:294 (-) Transcript_15543:66-947(-)
MSSSTTPYFATTSSSTGAGTTITVRFNNGKPEETPRFAIGYWSIRGLAAPLRMMLCAAKVDHTILMYDLVEDGDAGWTSDYFTSKPALKSKYSCALMNLPYVVDQTQERIVCQTNACFMHLGRQLGMMGGNETEQSVCEELLGEIYDLRNVMIKFAYTSGGTKEEAAGALTGATAHLKKLELFLTIQQEKAENVVPHHLVGATSTAPDFHLYEMLDQWTALHPGCLSEFPELDAFRLGFQQLEENQFYLESWLHEALPFNNLMAKFASAPEATVYERGQTASWRGKGEITMSP